MKNILLLFAFLFTLCANAQPPEKEFTETLVEMIRSGNTDNLGALMATPDIMREIAPDEVGNKSDKELEQMIEQMKSKFAPALEGLRRDLTSECEISSFAMTEVKIEVIDYGEESDNKSKISMMSISFECGQLQSVLPVIVVPAGDGYSLISLGGK